MKLPSYISDLTSLLAKIDVKSADIIVNDAILRCETLLRLQAIEQRKTQDVFSEDPLVTSEDIKKEFNIGHTYLNDLYKIGALKYVRSGRWNCVRRSELEQFKKKQESTTERQRIARLIKRRRTEEEEEKKKKAA